VIPITVHVPGNRVADFYIRFGEFLQDAPAPEGPLYVDGRPLPRWVQTDDAPAMAAKFMGEVSLPGLALLRNLVDAAQSKTAEFTPEQLVQATGSAITKQAVAGILGQVGKAVRRAGLPMYVTPRGNSWHYIWDWDTQRYSMEPEVARLLSAAWPR